MTPSISVTITGHAGVIKKVLEVVAQMEAEETGYTPGMDEEVKVEKPAKKADLKVVPKESTESFTLEQVKAHLIAIGRRDGNDKVTGILEEIGVGKISEIPAEKYADVMKIA